MITISARTADHPMTVDGATIVSSHPTPPAGQSYEVRPFEDGSGGINVVLVAGTKDASRLTRAALEAANVEGLKRILAASGAKG